MLSRFMFSALLLAFIGLFSACELLQDTPDCGCPPPDLTPEVIVIKDAATYNSQVEWSKQPGYSDDFLIESVTQTSDSLKILVTYGGGCKKHNFDLFWDGVVKTNPVQINLLMRHSANGDGCKKLIRETLGFKISNTFGVTGDHVRFRVINSSHTAGTSSPE